MTKGNHKQQALWFLVVGTLAAGVHFLSLFTLVQVFHWSPAWANIGAFCIAFMVSFLGHYQLTFRKNTSQRSFLTSLWRWLTVSLAGFVLNQMLFTLGLRLFGQTAYIPVWLVVTLLVTVITFIFGKFWAFMHQEKTSS